MLSLLKNGEFVRVMNAVAAGTTSQNSTGVDCSGVDAVTFVAAFGTITSGAVTSIKAQQSSDDGSSDDYTDIAGSSCTVADDQDNKVAVLEIVRPLKKYVRLVVVRGTQNAVIDGVIAITSHARKVPVSQGSTVVATSKTLPGPEEGAA